MLNPLIDKQRFNVQQNVTGNKLAISVHFLYFAYDAKVAAGEQFVGGYFCTINKI